MKNLTLVIPAKYEKITLPKVLNELEKFNVSKIIVEFNKIIDYIRKHKIKKNKHKIS